MEQLLDTEAVVRSISVSVEFNLFEMRSRAGIGNVRGGFPRFSSIGTLSPVADGVRLRPMLGGFITGSGRGWEYNLPAKLWQRATCEVGEGDRDTALEKDPFSEETFRRLRDHTDLIIPFCSVGLSRCGVSAEFSLVFFFFTSLEEYFPHHVGILDNEIVGTRVLKLIFEVKIFTI